GEPGIVDEDVEASELLGHAVDEFCSLRGICLVGAERLCAHPLRLEFGDHSLGLLFRRSTADRDVRTLAGQCQCRCCTDSPRSACDECCSAVQLSHDDSSSVVVSPQLLT